MTNLKCPFCKQKLEYCGAYIYGTKKLGCANCGLTGDSKLFEKLADTKKKLDICEGALEEYKDWFNKSQERLKIAVDALEYANKCIKGGCVNWETYIDKALEQINQKEEK